LAQKEAAIWERRAHLKDFLNDINQNRTEGAFLLYVLSEN
jgi:hypothetical protein